MQEFFGNLVQDLLVILEAPDQDFRPGEAVQIKLNSETSFSLEPAKYNSGLLVCWEIGQLPQSASREIWVKEALRWNEGDLDREGVFSMTNDIGMLCMHHIFSWENLDAQKLMEALERMEEKVLVWKEALYHGQPPQLSSQPSMSSSFKGPMMAFRP